MRRVKPKHALNTLPKYPKEKQRFYWWVPKNRRQFLDFVVEHLGTHYVNKIQLKRMGGKGILNYYTSVSKMMSVEFPEQALKMWHFGNAPKNWMATVAELFRKDDPVATCVVEVIVEEIIERVKIEGNATHTDDWRLAHFGFTSNQLLDFMRKRQATEIKKLVPSEKPFSLPQSGSIDNYPRNLRAFLDFIKDSNGGTFESLYNITYSDFIYHGATSLLCFAGSAPQAIPAAYPEHAWERWRFAGSNPKSFWSSISNALQGSSDIVALTAAREFITHICDVCGVKSPYEWTPQAEKKLSVQYKAKLQQLGGTKFVLEVLYPQDVDRRSQDETYKQLSLGKHVHSLLELPGS